MTTATYTRSGTTVTVTSPAHNLVVGDVVYADFTSGGALDGTYTVTGVSGSTFTFSTVASGTIATSNVNWLRTESATYSQSGTVITITKASHGYDVGKLIGLAFVGSNAHADKTYTIATVPTSGTFTVTADTSVTGSGGVQLFQQSQAASYVLSSTLRSVGASQTRNTQVAAYVLGSTMQNAAPTENATTQIAAYTLSSHFVPAGAINVSRTQQANYVLSSTATARAGRWVDMPTATYSLTSSMARCSPGGANEDQDVSLVPMRSSLIMRATMFVTRGQETVTSALDHMAKQCGLQFASQATEDLRQTLVTTLASALQFIYSRSAQLSYFNKKTITLTLNANTDTLTLPDYVQSLEGYIRVHGAKESIPTTHSRSEIDRFSDYYPDDDTPLQACFPLREARAHAEGFTHTLLFAPKPTEDTELDIDVLTQAPRYGWQDYLAQTALQIPHTYAQSILFPCLSKGISTALQFVNQDALQQIESDYQRARTILGAVDLAPASSGSDTARKAKAEA